MTRYPSLPYIAPFAVLIGLLALNSVLSMQDWMGQALWIAIMLAVLVFVSRPVLDFSMPHWWSSVLIGLLVFAVWIAPDLLFPGYHHHWIFENDITVPGKSSLASIARGDPLALALRTIRSAAIVPIAEELFWRAWLMRWMIKDDFRQVPLGTYTATSFWMVAILFASEHGPYWDVGLAAGIIYNWWMLRTRSLGDLILAHAVTNACLSAYVIIAGKWGILDVSTLAIDIGGTKLSVALFENKMITRRESLSTDRQGGPEWMVSQIESIVKGWTFDRCGVGFGGPVDFPAQRVVLSTHVDGWHEFPLVERLNTILGVPVVIDNDANVGALGESTFGAGRGCLPMFYMTLSTGIGGGIVLADGSIYRGSDSWAGELGHLTVRPDGPECLCGARGCLERMCCGLWLERDYGRPAELLLRDPEFVSRYVIDLAMGLKAVIMILNPAAIVIGGGIAQAGDALFQPLRAELRRQVTNWSRARLNVVPASLGSDSVLWGALSLVS